MKKKMKRKKENRRGGERSTGRSRVAERRFKHQL